MVNNMKKTILSFLILIITVATVSASTTRNLVRLGHTNNGNVVFSIGGWGTGIPTDNNRGGKQSPIYVSSATFNTTATTMNGIRPIQCGGQVASRGLQMPAYSQFNISTRDFTISTWAMPVTQSSSWVVLLSTTYSSDHNYLWWSMGTAPNANNMYLRISTDGSTWLYDGSLGNGTAASLGTWHHCVLERKGSIIYSWFDGVAGTHNITINTSSITFPSANVIIGSDHYGATLAAANILDYKIYNYAVYDPSVNARFTPPSIISLY